MKIEKASLVTGGFDPIHSGHISYLKNAKKLCGFLIVGLNSDRWLKRKKGYSFMPYAERENILKNFKFVDQVIQFNDDDDSASDAISKALDISQHIVFANGGDRLIDNIPEFTDFGKNKNVEFVFGVGGSNKINSSSWIIDEFIKNKNLSMDDRNYDILKIEAPWGHHDTIVDHPKYKLKQLFVKPGSKLSLQYHHHRSEHWIVTHGVATVQLGDNEMILEEGEYIFSPQGEKHRISNNSNDDLIIVEIQNGDILEESDIVRIEDSFGRK